MRASLLYPYYLNQGGGVPVSFYVRPAGETYGTGDGSSYENAWSGNDGIDWDSVRSGDTIFIAGEWDEAIVVDKSGVSILSVVDDPCTIDAQDSLTSCLSVTDLENVTITGVSLINATTSCLHIDSSKNIVTNHITVSGSGNQGIQHLGATTATHNNPTCSDNVDDGISVHDSGVITINGGTFDGNDQNINIVSTAQVTVNGSPTFTGTSSYDLYVTNAATPNSCVITMNGGTVRNVRADIGGMLVLNDVVVTGETNISQFTGAGSLISNKTIFEGQLSVYADGSALLQSSRIAEWGSIGGAVNLSKCVVLDDCVLSSTGSIFGNYCLVDGTGKSGILVDVVSGALGQFKNCIFKGMASTQFGIAFRTGASSESYVNNCVFIGNGQSGRGLFSQIDITVNNNIYYDLAIGHFRSAGTHVLNNCCFYNCATDKQGTVTSNNEITGDPAFADVENNDYSLGEGSSCIGTGADLGSTFLAGIDTAVWGDGDTAPVVTTADQSENWNIGAYV